MRLLGNPPITTSSSSSSSTTEGTQTSGSPIQNPQKKVEQGNTPLIDGTSFNPIPLLALPMELSSTQNVVDPYSYLVHICHDIKMGTLKPNPQQIALLNDMIHEVNY